MNIEINTGHDINGSEEMIRYTKTLVEDILGRFEEHINHVEVHITDENNKKGGSRSKRCLIETRLKGQQPFAVTDEAETANQSVIGAANKLKRSLEHTLGRLSAHEDRKHMHNNKYNALVDTSEIQ